MKKNNIIGGILLILLAAFVVLNKVGMLPDIPWFRLIISIFMAYLVIRSIPKLNFFGIIMPLCVIGCVFDTELGIEAVTPWTLLLAGLLLSGGLGLIFKRKKHIEIEMKMDMNERTINEDDGRIIHLDNNFNSVSKYVNTEAFTEAYIENSFGSCNVYFNNAVMANGTANMELDNNFGQMNIYIPKTWRMELDRDVSFGNLRIHGEPNADMDAPCVVIKAECTFGNLNLFLE